MAIPCEKTSFIAALIGSCQGTRIFDRLKNQYPGRALWHLLLLLILCALAVATLQLFTYGDKVNDSFDRFRAVFGGLAVQGPLIRPELRTGDARSLLLPGGGIVSYVPTGQVAALPEKTGAADFNYLLYWLPSRVVMAKKIGDADFAVGVFQPGSWQNRQQKVSSAEFDSFLAEQSGLDAAEVAKVKADVPIQVIGEAELRTLVKGLWFMLAFGLFVMAGYAQIMVYLLIFVGMFHLTGARNIRTLNFRQLFVTALYAGFPALLVASCFPALDLPLLSFGSAFVIGMILYFLVTVNRIERESTPDEPTE